jgi:hypothetical protein
LLGIIYPDNYAAGEQNTGFVNMENYHRAVAEIYVGDLAATATLDADLEEAQDALGTGRANVKSITQLTQAGGDGDDVVVVEFRTEEFDVDNGYEFLNLEVTTANAAVDYCAVLWGIIPRYPPVPTTLITEVVG